MKLKGLNTFEQHLEKVVLGVAALAVVGIAGWQYLSAPAVKVGSKSASHGEIDGLLEKSLIRTTVSTGDLDIDPESYEEMRALRDQMVGDIDPEA
jgi:hypothetical protein